MPEKGKTYKQPATICRLCAHCAETGWKCHARRVVWSVLDKSKTIVDGPPWPKCIDVNDGRCTFFKAKGA